MLAAVLPYAGALGGGFVFDDHALVEQAPERAWTGGLWGDLPAAGYYRPLVLLSFALDRAVGSGSPLPYHLTSLVLHALVALTAFALCRRLGAAPATAALAATLFTLHPVHVEPVAWISARGDLLAALLGLAGWLVLARDRDATASAAGLAGLLWLGALLAKESAAAIPLMALWAVWLQPRTQRQGPSGLRRAGVTAAAGAAALGSAVILRLVVLGSLRGPLPPDPLENPAALLPLPDRIATAGAALARALGLLAWPWPLRADYGVPVTGPVPWSTGHGLAALLLVAAALGGALLLGLRARRAPRGSRLHLAALGSGAAVAAWLPVSSLGPAPGSLLAERYLLLPSWGFTLLLATALVDAGGRISRLRLAAAGTLAAAAVLAILARVPDWRDDRALFTAESRRTPHSYKADYLAALLAWADGDDDASLAELHQCLAKAPGFSPCHEARARSLLRQGDAAAAADAARAALAAAPRQAPGVAARYRVLLAEALWESGQPAAAEGLLRAAMRGDAASATAPRRLGDLLFATGRAGAAAAAYREAAARDPEDPVAAFNLAMALIRSGRAGEAEAALETVAALPYAPGAVWFHLGLLADEAGRREEARRHLERFLEQAAAGESALAEEARRRLGSPGLSPAR